MALSGSKQEKEVVHLPKVFDSWDIKLSNLFMQTENSDQGSGLSVKVSNCLCIRSPISNFTCPSPQTEYIAHPSISCLLLYLWSCWNRFLEPMRCLFWFCKHHLFFKKKPTQTEELKQIISHLEFPLLPWVWKPLFSQAYSPKIIYLAWWALFPVHWYAIVQSCLCWGLFSVM